MFLTKKKEEKLEKIVQVSNKKKFNCVNVRNDKGIVIGTLPVGCKVVVDGDFSEKKERTAIFAKNQNKKIKGTVLTSCLK